VIGEEAENTRIEWEGEEKSVRCEWGRGREYMKRVREGGEEENEIGQGAEST